MISFPNCKINLGLHITRKRSDGYHDLETVFYPINLTDIIEIVQFDKTAEELTNGFRFTASGITVDGDPENNLCVKAYRILKKDFPILPPTLMHLHKSIPMGAGLGGGSADGAFMLKLLNEKYQLGLSTEQLLDYALRLGSDCPFFIMNKPCFATGRGEIMTRIDLDLSQYYFLLVNPGIHINTGWAFKQVNPFIPAIPLMDIIARPVKNWKGHLINDFEDSVLNAYPQMKEVKESLYASGAVYASMTGTGSTIFGIYSQEPQKLPLFPEPYTVHIVK